VNRRNVTGADLKRAALHLAVAALLLPRYAGQGSRHEGALVLGGVLSRARWTENDIRHLVGVIARHAGDDDVRDRVETAASALAAALSPVTLPIADCVLDGAFHLVGSAFHMFAAIHVHSPFCGDGYRTRGTRGRSDSFRTDSARSCAPPQRYADISSGCFGCRARGALS
jgi:hypothetical protein